MNSIISAARMDVNRTVRIPQNDALHKNHAMQTIDEIRRQRLALLIKEAGSQTRLAEATEIAQSQISQWLNASKDSKTGTPRAMNKDSARELERRCNKPTGWMDQPISTADRQPTIKPPIAAEAAAPYVAAGQPGYSAEALALGWLLDQVTDRMAKIRANHDATQAILNVLQQLDAPPTATPAAPSSRAKPNA